MSKGFEIDWETADRITLLNLKNHRDYLFTELEDYKLGHFLHPDDVINNKKLIKSLDKIINYFGDI